MEHALADGVNAEFVRAFRLLSPERLAMLLGYAKAQLATELVPEVKQATQMIVAAAERVTAERQPTSHLTHTGGIGCSYTDQEGNPWSTRRCINHTQTCSVCGKEASSGYAKGKLGQETFYCGCTIQTHYPTLEQEATNG